MAALRRPYDIHSLIDLYVITRGKDFIHPDFPAYYHALLPVLEEALGVPISRPPERFEPLYELLQDAVRSMRLVRQCHPLAGYIEHGGLMSALERAGQPGAEARNDLSRIRDAVESSAAAHRSLLYHLVVAIYGPCDRVVTSQQLVGFDDSREPRYEDYLDSL